MLTGICQVIDNHGSSDKEGGGLRFAGRELIKHLRIKTKTKCELTNNADCSKNRSTDDITVWIQYCDVIRGSVAQSEADASAVVMCQEAVTPDCSDSERVEAVG